MEKAIVHSIETFGSVDGPGIRYILFLKGCRLRCAFCHNADTWNMESDDQRSADEIIAHALRYRPYWGKDGAFFMNSSSTFRMQCSADRTIRSSRLSKY